MERKTTSGKSLTVIYGVCLVAVLWLVFGLPAFCWSLELTLPARVHQGDIFVGRITPPAEVFADERALPVSPAGYFAVGISRERKNDLVILGTDGKKRVSKKIQITAYPWIVQRIDGLPNAYVDPPLEARKIIRGDNQRVLECRTGESYPDPLFLKDGFSVPVEGVMTSVFGSQRILNGRSRSPHRGVDFAVPEGTLVVSPADGIVTMTATGMYLMGNVLMIDHGLGVQSIFIHLERILVRKGDRIKKGEGIALAGKTGRATGPHLHWGVSAGATVVDPARVLKGVYGIP